MPDSTLSYLAGLSPQARTEILQELGPEYAAALEKHWRFIARAEQRAPGTEGAASERKDWSYWLYLAGRGAGKTRSGAEWVVEQAKEQPGSHGALVAGTASDSKKVMVSYGQEHQEDASGILAVSPPDFRPKFEPSKLLLTWPNGSTAGLYSAEEPERLRGPQEHWAWCDELGAWKRPQDTWDMLTFGLRLGRHPQACITTTPRPIPLVRQLLDDPATAISRGTTYDNRENLAPSFLHTLVARYEGTRLGRQELLAELLEDVPGALWRLGMIDALRLPEPPDLVRIVVGVDPAVTSNEKSDETGIVVAGVDKAGQGYVLADASGIMTPHGWASEAVAQYHRWKADRIVGEVNNGGDLVEMAIRTVDPKVSYKSVWASRGKAIRAEPIAALYEQKRVNHCGIIETNGHRTGSLVKLEDEMCSWDPTVGGKSPGRMDALVWALTDLMLGRYQIQVPKITLPNLTKPSDFMR